MAAHSELFLCISQISAPRTLSAQAAEEPGGQEPMGAAARCERVRGVVVAIVAANVVHLLAVAAVGLGNGRVPDLRKEVETNARA